MFGLKNDGSRTIERGQKPFDLSSLILSGLLVVNVFSLSLLYKKIEIKL